MNVLLLQLDGTGPNLALLRLAAHHRERGHAVELRKAYKLPAIERRLGDDFQRVYASAIFSRSRPLCERVQRCWPGAVIGGTGWDYGVTLESLGIDRRGPKDYTDWPTHRESIGFTQRGCRLSCEFCVVPKKEGRPQEEDSIPGIWRGEPWPKWILLLDNDFFGVPTWRRRIEEIRAGGFKVCFNQGINCRMISPEAAEAIASIPFCDDQFHTRRIYTAWDSLDDERTLFRGIDLLKAAGIAADDIMVYMLCGYWPGETQTDREYRRLRLREAGVRPYPMPFVRTDELKGFQRWVIGAYDKTISWTDWEANRYRPERLAERRDGKPMPLWEAEP